MKSRETKAQDLAALTESLQNSTSAMVVSFTGLSVTKDQEFRNSLREAGAEYSVVKNTLARIAVKGTQFTINNRAIFLRGTLECCIFPLTGYPPTDVASWKRILTIARERELQALYNQAMGILQEGDIEAAAEAVPVAEPPRRGLRLFNRGS